MRRLEFLRAARRKLQIFFRCVSFSRESFAGADACDSCLEESDDGHVRIVQQKGAQGFIEDIDCRHVKGREVVKRVVGGELGEDEEDILGGRELRTKGESHRRQCHRRLNLKYSVQYT